MFLESNQSSNEESAFKCLRVARPSLVILVLLAMVTAWYATYIHVLSSAFKITSMAYLPLLHAFMCVHFDYLYFLGAQAHAADTSKAALVRYLSGLNL